MSKFKSGLFIVIMVTVFFTSTFFAYAQSPNNQRLYTKLTLRQIASIMEDMNYDFELYEEKEVVAWIMPNDELSLISTDKTNSLNFYTYEDTQVDFAVVNRWNHDYKFSKTYLDKDNDVTLELDLDLTGGVTEARIKDFFKTCEVSHDEWLRRIRVYQQILLFLKKCGIIFYPFK